MEIDSKLQEIRDRLLLSGCEFSSMESIKLDVYESALNVSFSADWRSYFETIVGDKGVYACENVQLHGIGDVTHAMAHEKSLSREQIGDYFVIANYLDWCWAYCANVTETFEMPIYIISNGKPKLAKVADNFNMFVQLSIKNSSEIL